VSGVVDPNLIDAGLVLLIAFLVCVACILRMRALRRKGYAKWRRIGGMIVLSVVILIAAAVGTGATFNAVAAQYFFARHPAPGRVYDVGGYKMHLYCTGEGSPALIADAGLSNDSLIWGNVQPELSKITRVCSYDRAGFGWSERRPDPRDADRIVQELHGLLTAAGITGPIVLMGHSISGVYIRAYASHYPQNLSGLIFVDGSTPLQDDRFPAKVTQAEKNAWFQFLIAKWVYILGIPRLMGQCSHAEGFSGSVGEMIAEDQCRPSLFTAVAQEDKSFKQSGNETIHTGPFGDVPILILSEDPEHSPPSDIPPQAAESVSKIWNEMQEELKNLSTRSRRIIARGSGHYVQIDRASLLNEEVTNFIKQIRGEMPAPTDYGSTKIK
jgi:pimeloyl-ACP methyl ester carboxylesterase